MMNLFKMMVLFLSISLLTACFKEIPYPNIDGNKQYVINCIFEINTTPVAKVYQTAILGANSTPEIFSEAQLLLYDSIMGKIDSFVFDPISQNYTCNTICTEKNKYFLVLKNINSQRKENPKNLVFLSHEGRQVTRFQISSAWLGIDKSKGDNSYYYPGVITRLIDEGKLSYYLKPSSTRHTFITLQAQAGTDLKLLADSCGNSVETIYTHYLGANRTSLIIDI
jgi:hypothetical protein